MYVLKKPWIILLGAGVAVAALFLYAQDAAEPTSYPEMPDGIEDATGMDMAVLEGEPPVIPGIAHSGAPLGTQSPDSGGFESEEPAMADTPGKFATGTNMTGSTASIRGTDDLITFEITGGVLQSIAPNAEYNAIAIGITATDDGLLTITIPRTMMDALLDDGQDDQYFVLVDEEEVNHEETTTSTDRTLAIRFPTGSEEILIIRAWV